MRIVRCEAIPGLAIALDAITPECEERLFKAKQANVASASTDLKGRTSFFQTLAFPFDSVKPGSKWGGLSADDFRVANFVNDSSLCDQLYPNYVHTLSYTYHNSEFHVSITLL